MDFVDFLIRAIGVISLGLLLVGFPIWAVIDALTFPERAWGKIQSKRAVWLALNIVLGFVGSAFYAGVIRRQLVGASADLGLPKSPRVRSSRFILLGVLGLLAVAEVGALKYPGYEVLGRDIPATPISHALKITASKDKPKRATFLNQERYIHIFAADDQFRIYEFYSWFPKTTKSEAETKSALRKHGFEIVTDRQPKVLAARLFGRFLLPMGAGLAIWVFMAQSKGQKLGSGKGVTSGTTVRAP